jgi:hypothetical protein
MGAVTRSQPQVGDATTHADATGTTVTVALGPDRLDLPEPFDILITKLPRHRRIGAAAHLPTDWLFPSGRAGKHISAGAMSKRLLRIGIGARQKRHAALMQLAAEISPALLAGVLGIHPTTAVKWAGLAGGGWTNYAAARATNDQ